MPWKGPLLIISNHESFYDPPIVGCAVGRRVTFMARKTLFDNPVFGFLIRRCGAFTVDQDGSGIDGIRQSLKEFEAGEAVVVFPEGTRTEDGNMVPFMAGIGLLIRKAKVPVLPVGIAGGYESLSIHMKKPRISFPWKKPGPETLTAVVGQAISSEELLKMDTKSMVRYLQEKVSVLRDEAKRKRETLLQTG